MRISLHLFAALHDAAGARDLDLNLPEGATVADVKERLAADYPALRPLLPSVVCAIDDEYVAFEERLHEGARLALIPPVSSGAPEGDVATDDGLFRVTAEALDGNTLAALVRSDADGAVALFYGVVRNFSEGRAVERLEYEAYASMALKKLREVAAETRQRFPDVGRVGAWHRIGLLEIGETSLLVAVASPHRLEAFEACHWAVDRIKEVVPVWKKEHWAGGSAWLEGHTVEPPHLASS